MASSRKKIGVDLKIIGFAIIVRCIKFVSTLLVPIRLQVIVAGHTRKIYIIIVFNSP